MLRRAWPIALAIAACSEAQPAPSGESAAPPSATSPIVNASANASPTVNAISSASQAVNAVASAPPSLPAGAACTAKEAAGAGIFVSPRAPRAGAPLRVLAFSEAPIDAALVIRDAAGADVAGSRERHGGPPFWWSAEIPAAAEGAYRAWLVEASGASCKEIAVEVDPAPEKRRAWGVAWGVRAAWDRAAESLYSAWIERLFDAPVEQQLTWPALHDVLRDRARNLLHDHLGQGEDDAGPKAIAIEPDCADLPYFLRAYFAFKLGLPFGYSACTRGGGGLPPRCQRWRSNLEPTRQRTAEADTFGDFLRVTLADTVHSGTGRSPADDDAGDYYPVPLTLASLRPGTIYADPYGHVLVVSKRIPESEAAGGVLLAVDGQPDGTVSRRRFWRGNFLFAIDPALGSPGFKRFRPVVVGRGGPRALGNREIMESADYADYALDQYAGGVEGFYDTMDDVLSPSPASPERAMREAIAALEEQVKGRVTSVQNGQRHWLADSSRIDMPDGSAIFETTGPWEDFSTPSRDLRLLIAIDVVRGFPERVARRPGRFAMPPGKPIAEVKAELEAVLAGELAKRTFAYERSDGSTFTLSLADVAARAEDLELAYNPNDCVEVRWGAPAGSEEASTCRRRASPGQAARMRRYRPWFHERRRPPRG